MHSNNCRDKRNGFLLIELLLSLIAVCCVACAVIRWHGLTRETTQRAHTYLQIIAHTRSLIEEQLAAPRAGTTTSSGPGGTYTARVALMTHPACAAQITVTGPQGITLSTIGVVPRAPS